MDPQPSAREHDDWLAHAQALRRLAHGLIRDGHEVDDLLQEVWLRSERAGQRSRKWLGTVLRNLLRDRARSRARRGATERAAARAELVPSEAEIVERLEVAERLAREVAALSEPQRTVVYLRYFEDLGPEEIAARLAQPLETTRTHLRRGLARLRERMDQCHGGDGRAWALALVPLARPGTGSGAAAASTVLTAGMQTIGVAMGTKLVLSTAAVSVAALGCLLWSRRQAATPLATLAQAPAAALESALQRDDPPAPREALREALVAEPAAPPVAASPAAARVVTGSVVIEDEEGEEHDSEAGTLSLVSGMSEADAAMRDIAFEDGRFSFELEEGHWFAFGRLVARGREAVLPRAAPLFPGPDPVVVRGRWLRRGRLRVLDALTGAELKEVELRCADGWRANPEWSHPGDHASIRTVIAGADSPLELPDRTWLTPYWVHVPGYAWTRVDFDHRVGGERTVELSRERATVAVTVVGATPEHAFVRLYRARPDISQGKREGNSIVIRLPPPAERPSWLADVSQRADPSGTTRIVDLAPGPYLAMIEVGEYEDRLKLGSAEVEVLAGMGAHVEVPVDATLLDAPRTHLRGTIRVPTGLVIAECSLRLERLEPGEKAFSMPLAEMSHPKGDERTLLWDAGPMRTGTYLATIRGIEHRLVIDAERAGGETRVDIEIPPLVTVRAEVVDAVTGAPLEPERVQWCDGPLPGVSSRSLVSCKRLLGSGTFEFVAPQGQVEVRAALFGYEDASQELELAGREAHARLELHCATGIWLALREGEATLPVDLDFWRGVRVVSSDGERAHRFPREGRGGALLIVDGPGHYAVSFPELAGFLPLQPFEVDVGAGEVVERVLAVAREP